MRGVKNVIPAFTRLDFLFKSAPGDNGLNLTNKIFSASFPRNN